MGRLFGTDGARGVANSELTPELAMNIGRAAAAVLITKTHQRPKVLIGEDTRISGDLLKSAMAAGFCSVGADVLMLGTVPTPAVAYLVREYGYDAGVMISASHNPYEYNGIKIFQSNGFKLPDESEEAIESVILDDVELPPVKTGAQLGRVRRSESALRDYEAHLLRSAGENCGGMKIALDCANGSCSATARQLFEAVGCECVMLAAEPDGLNINCDCGSTHIENLRAYMKKSDCAAGFAFDGDGDRLIAVDEKGNTADGDKIIALCALDMKETGRLRDNRAVVTVMSNMGFFKFAEQNGIDCEITKVGDRYVLENMLENNCSLGGEQSGHVIFLDYATTGDGQLTALQILKAMRRTGKSLSELASVCESFPQLLKNVRVSDFGKARFEDDEEIKTAIRKAKEELGEEGRVLVRVSGTEPLVRVMLEGKDLKKIDRLCDGIVSVVKERLL